MTTEVKGTMEAKITAILTGHTGGMTTEELAKRLATSENIPLKEAQAAVFLEACSGNFIVASVQSQQMIRLKSPGD